MKKKLICLAVVVAIILAASAAVFAAGYDSSTDPLVTLSYLTGVFKPRFDADISALRAEIAELNGEIAALKQSQTAEPTKTEEPTVTSEPTEEPLESGFRVLFLNYGDKIYCESAAELTLRSGSASVISPFNDEGLKQGLNDYTTGNELLNGDSVPLNHYLLIPRGSDGRGIIISSKDGAYVVVRGEVVVHAAQ